MTRKAAKAVFVMVVGVSTTLFPFANTALAAVYSDNFEGPAGGSFLSDWVSNNQQGFLSTTTKAFSPTHSFVSAATYSEDSLSIPFAANTRGTLTAKVYCDTIDYPPYPPPSDPCFNFGVSQGTGASYDGIYQGMSFLNNGTTTLAYIINNNGSYLAFPPTYHEPIQNNYILNAWNDFRVDWRLNLGLTEIRVYLNDTYDSGWISTATSTPITAVMIASFYWNNVFGGIPYAFIDNVEVKTDADAPEPPSSTSFISSFTYSTTTEMARITGFWEATTTPHITQELSFWQYSDQFGQEDFALVVATTTGAFDFSFPFRGSSYSTTGTGTTTAPILSSFTLNASLDQYNDNYYDPFGLNGLDVTKYKTTLDTAQVVISGINYGVNDYSTTTRGLALYPEYECGITSLTGCFKNALIWTFYPTQAALDNWQTFTQLLQTKAPVGYFTITKNAINGLSATSTSAFSITIPAHLRSYIFNPIDIGLASIFWVYLIFSFYKRLKHITI